MRLGISLAAQAPALFRAAPQQADRARHWPRATGLQGGGRDDRAARAIIDSACRQIPAVEMAANEDWGQGRIGARYLADHIARLRGAREARGQHKMGTHGLACLRDTVDQHGIGHRDGRCRNGRNACGPLRQAGVCYAGVVCADRADQYRQGALFCGDSGALAAHIAIEAIGFAGLGGWHRMIDKGDLAFERERRRGL